MVLDPHLDLNAGKVITLHSSPLFIPSRTVFPEQFSMVLPKKLELSQTNVSPIILYETQLLLSPLKGMKEVN